MNKLSKTAHFVALNIHAALNILAKNGDEMRYSDICNTVQQSRDFTDWERTAMRNGMPRWQTHFNFFAIEITKVGYIARKNGVWYLTEEGRRALANDKDPEDFFLRFHDIYKKITRESRSNEANLDKLESIYNIDNLQNMATKNILNSIVTKNPYEFQDLVAALLRAMGYYTPFIAPKGKDGGIDIIAYQDPLGMIGPQLKVQVKHHPNSMISVDVVRSLCGIISKERECGLIVTSGKFTHDAELQARNLTKTLRLIDVDEFIDLWIKYYDKMTQDDKSLLPIIPIYFIKND